MALPDDIANACAPLFETLPLDEAMPGLVVRGAAKPERVALVEQVMGHPALRGKASLCAGLWLYVDDLDRSHTISQGMPSATGSYWHGIMHRREGDFGNSHYWFHRVGNHPAMANIDGYDGHEFVDAVAAAGPGTTRELVALQRREWMNLFTWCAVNGDR